jgi:hypothetical protein
MRSRSALAPHTAAPVEEHIIAPVASAQPPLRQDAAANDEESMPTSSFRGDPLFGMAIATVILFVFLAALMV